MPSHLWCKYSAFTDNVERNCHLPAESWSCYNIGELFLLVLWRDTWLTHRENFVSLGSEPFSSSQEPGSDECVCHFNCFPVYQWTHCILLIFILGRKIRNWMVCKKEQEVLGRTNLPTFPTCHLFEDLEPNLFERNSITLLYFNLM
jgi:hypothetical protein